MWTRGLLSVCADHARAGVPTVEEENRHGLGSTNEEAGTVMDIIKCIDCNTPDTEWVHGIADRDPGGTSAHSHKMQNPDHKVWTGDAVKLSELAAEENK